MVILNNAGNPVTATVYYETDKNEVDKIVQQESKTISSLPCIDFDIQVDYEDGIF